MSGSTALYRKYRPGAFQEVLGQEQVVKALESAISIGQISHAYLFSGSRGTGKTSVARIFASAIGTGEIDLYEIDAASNRGIDDVRALREAVLSLPFESKYKVYIIDEAHMLTKEAFNALLKTLEEPPTHVIFILATTEAHKLLDTVVSRCQVFHFKKPGRAVLRRTVEKVSEAEGRTLAPEAAEIIAFLGDGSFRDSLGVLDKVLRSSADKHISENAVRSVYGVPRASLVNDFISAVAARDAAKGLSVLDAVREANLDVKVCNALIMRAMRFVLLLRYSIDMEDAIREETGEDDFAILKALAGDRKNGINAAALAAFLKATDNVGRNAIPTLPMELALLELCEKV